LPSARFFRMERYPMDNKDDFLQQQLQALENGDDLEQVAAGLSEEDQDLAQLIRLASAIRSLPHPEPERAAVPEWLPAHQSPSTRLVTPPSQKTTQKGDNIMQRIFNQLTGTGRRSLTAPAVLVGAALVLLVAIFVIGLSGGAPAAVAQNVSGRVEVAAAGETLDWKPLRSGERVETGAHLRTSPGSSAELVYTDGSRTTLQSDTQVVLTSLNGRRGQPVNVVLYQEMGTSRHQVVPFAEGAGLYMVQTPNGVVNVHGTIFSVFVDREGRSRYLVDKGLVSVTSEESQVFLYSGQVTRSSGDALEFPAYSFSIHGTLEKMNGSIWTVAGVPITLVEETIVEENPQTGDYVFVDGRVLDSSEWVADRIGFQREENPEQWFTGIVEKINGEEWIISSWQLRVDDDTAVDAGVVEGSSVRVKFEVLDGGEWHAVQILNLEEPHPELPVDTLEPVDPAITPDPVAGPIGADPEDESQANTVYCTGAEPHPTGSRLAQRYNVTYDEIMVWFCQGFGFGEIDLAYELSARSEIDVSAFFDRKLKGEGWGEIKNSIDGQYINPEDQEEAGEEAGQESTGEFCVGAQPHPTAIRLSERFPATYQEIMGYFCDGFGFGEIELAYELSEITGAEVDAYFDRKQSGESWGEIKQEVYAEYGRTEKPDKPGKPENVGKPELPEKPEKPVPPGQDKKDKDK
jgi:hypothetical protein